MKKRLLYFLILLLFFQFFGFKSEAVSIDVSGSWDLTISSDDLIAGPGSGLKSEYESNTDTITINVLVSMRKNRWRLYVKRIDQNWHDDFILYIRRTSDGTTYPGALSGGTSYQQITTSDQLFFTCLIKSSVFGITAQLKLNGVSVSIPPGTYITQVYYTVIDYY